MKPDRIVLDDPWYTTSEEERRAIVASWWKEALSSRLNHCAPVVIMARLHDQDTPGFVLDVPPGTYDYLVIPPQQETHMHPSNEPGADAAATIEMPRYQCHKKVWALKIGSVQPVVGGAAILTPADTRYAPFNVDQAFVDKHKPQAGGYYVVYDGDGYKSFSPAKAFEEGYTLIKPDAEDRVLELAREIAAIRADGPGGEPQKLARIQVILNGALAVMRD